MSAGGSPAQQSKAERLRRAARPLRPVRAPFYVQHGAGETPLVGWYWQPQGCPVPIPLGANYDQCVGHLAVLVASLKPKVVAA